MLDWDILKANTDVAFHNPVVGDYFNERFVHWVWVVQITDNYIYYLTVDGSTAEEYGTRDYPYCGKLWKSTPEIFAERYKYGGTTEGYWAMYSGNDICVDTWYDMLINEGRKVHIHPEPNIRRRKVIW